MEQVKIQLNLSIFKFDSACLACPALLVLPCLSCQNSTESYLNYIDLILNTLPKPVNYAI